MRAAIKIAQKGLQEGEVPIGAVVVYEDKVVARGTTAVRNCNLLRRMRK